MNKAETLTLYMKSDQFNARSKDNFLFAMALNFYKLNKK